MSIEKIYQDAADLTKRLVDDAAGRACVEQSNTFAGHRPVAIHGPVRAYTSNNPIHADPTEAAVEVANSGTTIALSVAVHRAMPGFGAGGPSIDVAELRPVTGGPSYWHAAIPDRGRLLPADSPILLFGASGAPHVAVSIASLRASFAAATAATDRRPGLMGPLRQLIVDARNRALAELFSEAALAAISDRQAILAEATASSQSRRLAALGAVPLVPLRVTRDELSDEATGAIPELLSTSTWTVRQPILDDPSGRISRYVDGRAGAAMLARNFGGRPTRLLCFDAGRLEFDGVRAFSRRHEVASHRAKAESIRGAVAASRVREAALVTQQVSSRPLTLRSVYGPIR